MEYQWSTTIDLLSQGLGRGPVDRWQTRSSTDRHSLPRALVKISFGQNIKVSFGQQIIKAQMKKMICWANTSQWQEAPTQPLQETWFLQVDRNIVRIKLKLQYFLQQCEVIWCVTTKASTAWGRDEVYTSRRGLLCPMSGHMCNCHIDSLDRDGDDDDDEETVLTRAVENAVSSERIFYHFFWLITFRDKAEVCELFWSKTMLRHQGMLKM